MMKASLLAFLLQIITVRSFTPHFSRSTRQRFHHARAVLHSSSLDEDSLISDGFDRSCQVDTTIQKLREQIPLLLLRSLDKISAAEVYAESFVLLGPNDEELASDIDELITLSTTLVTASTATRQASRLARSFAAPEANSEEDEAIVSSEMVLDVSKFDKLQVKWETTLLGAGTSKITGLSEVVLNEDGLVSQHKLVDLKIDDQPLNAVGEALATLRRAIKSMQVQASPLLALAASFPLLNEIRDELLQLSATATAPTVELPPLYAATSITSFFNSSVNMTLIDDFESPFPLPGSLHWTKYVTSQRAITEFVEKGIPVLSIGSPKEELYALFSSNCDLIGIDGTVICSGAEKVADFYRTLASIRQGTLGNWKVQGVDADWKTRSVDVKYVANNPVRVEGKDRYVLSESSLIEKIEQLEIVVSGTKVEDPDWFRQFYQAVKTGRSTVGADVVLDLIEQVTSGRKVSDLKSEASAQLSDGAAASVYGILCTLHQDIASLSTLVSPPAAKYIAPSIELRGYLNEVLSRGEASYKAAIGVALISLRGAIRSERVVLEQPPKPTIIFQPDGRIRVDLVLNLRLKTLSIGQDVGLPLKLELISDYRVNKEGKIVEHTIVETRVNDILTPGDVVTRFLKGTTLSEGALPVQSVLDALNWARNIAGKTSE